MSKNRDISDPRFGARVEALRLRLGLTREQLADKAGTTYRTILDIENAKRHKSQEGTLIRIAGALGVSLDHLLDLDTPLPVELEPAPEPAEPRSKPALRSRRRVWGVVAVAAVLVAAAGVLFPDIHGGGGDDPPWSLDRDLSGLPISQVTTSSPCAYRHYVEGWQHLQKLQRDDARAAFRAAIECDSTFAMAYLMLDHPYMWPPADMRRALIARAIHFSNHVSEREQLHIEALRHWIDEDFDGAIAVYRKIVDRYPKDTMAMRLLAMLYQVRGHVPEAIAMYELAVHEYPEDGMSLNRLAYAHFTEGNYTRALECAERYIEAEPRLANPYDTRGDILAWSGLPGDWEEAVASYEQALARDPGFAPSIQSLAMMHLLSGDFGKARRYIDRLSRSTNLEYRARARLLRGAVPIFEGRFGEARELLTRGIADDRADGGAWEEDGPPCNEVTLANLCELTGDDAKAAAWADSLSAWMKGCNPNAVYDWHADVVRLHALTDTTAAAAALDSLAARVDGDDWRYLTARGWMETARGNLDEARAAFSRANTRVRGFAIRYSLALVCLEMGDAAQAAHQLEYTLRRPTAEQVMYGPWRVKAHYYLARAYEQLGRPADAAGQYRQFLSWWETTDTPIAEVNDARARLAALAAPAEDSPPPASGPFTVAWDRGQIWVRDLNTKNVLWSQRYEGNQVEAVQRVMWDGREYVAYGLSGAGPDCGALFVRDLATGELRWRDGPHAGEAARVFGPRDTAGGTFLCSSLARADIDGDGVDELIGNFHHTKWYPAYLRIYRADGSVVGCYFNRGAIDEMCAADIDGDGKDEVIASGTNNTPAYQGATVFILDDTHHSGASVDSLSTLAPGLADSCVARVVFPAFEKRYMDRMSCIRLRARALRTYRTPGGETRIQCTVGTDAYGVVVLDLDAGLDVLSWGIADTLDEHVQQWAPTERDTFEQDYIPQWLRRVYRYGAQSSLAVR